MVTAGSAIGRLQLTQALSQDRSLFTSEARSQETEAVPTIIITDVCEHAEKQLLQYIAQSQDRRGAALAAAQSLAILAKSLLIQAGFGPGAATDFLIEVVDT
jgi:hypothetical protein